MESVFQKQAFPRHVGHDMTLPRSQKGIWGQKGEFGGRKGVFDYIYWWGYVGNIMGYFGVKRLL